MSKEIEATVSAILESAGVTMEVHYVGLSENALGGSHAMDEWRCNFRGKKPVQSFEFFTGIGHRTPAPKPMDGGPAPRANTLMWERLEAQRKPVAPHAASVLHSIIADSSAVGQSFESWCGDFGHDTDSRKAYATYEACQKNTDKLQKVFGHAVIEQLREALQDY